MAVLKCKMCGGTLDVTESMTVCECEYCGTQQTITTSKDENMQGLFNRANILRMKSEFDKAEQLYEKLVQNNPDDAEAHWGLILCKFGIEYVEDPQTFKRIPTCHRTSFDSIIADEDYKEALRCADSVQRDIYEREAREIDRLQKEILALSAKEEPYDVFICYKESDNGSRTPDSVIANDIYYQLTNEGFKVFYAAISLENKLGSAYEPCIFAALNSAKVMLAIGTKPEYFNAVWVKNEWSRFLKMMKKDRSKLLIPCYKNMDAYELPEEFAHLQAQDMGKIGFINDIVRGIRKVVVKDEPKPAQTVIKQASSGNTNVNSLLKRVFIFLEDGDWSSADEYCEKVLDLDPENGEAYLGKLMAELKVSKRDNLKNCAQPFDGSGNYKKIMRYGDSTLTAEMQGCTDFIKKRNLLAYQESIYQKAAEAYNKSSSTKSEITEAKKLFESISDYKDAGEYIRKCDEKLAYLENRKKQNTYDLAGEKLTEAKAAHSAAASPEEYQKAIDLFDAAELSYQDIKDFLDSDARIQECESLISECKEKKRGLELAAQQAAEAAARKKKIVAAVVSATVLIATAAACLIIFVVIPETNYNNAVSLMNEGKYDEAITAFEAMNGYKDSVEQMENCMTAIKDKNYDNAVSLMNEGKYDEAINAFESMNGYKDSTVQIEKCQTAIKDKNYDNAVSLMNEGKYDEAAEILYEIKDYKDSSDKLAEIIAELASIGAKNSASISAGGDHTVGLKKDGTVVAVGYNKYGQCYVSGWRDIIAVSAGGDHTVGLKKDGTVVAAGDNYYGQCNVSGWSDIIAVSVGWHHTVGLKRDGTVVAVGYNKYGQCDVSGWRDIIAVSARWDHTVGLKKDGTVVAVGDNYYGQCNVSGWSDIIAVSVGGHHTVGLKRDGTVVAVGYNKYGQCDVSGWSDIIAVSARGYHTVGLKRDGTVVAVGSNFYGRCDVSGWSDIIAVSAGDIHTVGLKRDGTVVAIGYNSDGRCKVSGWKLKTVEK